MDAARTAGARATLGVNWRSDQALVEAYDVTFGGARLGHPDITYRRVESAAANHGSRLIGRRGAEAALRVRIVDRADGLVGLTGKEWAARPSALQHIIEDLAADVVGLLSADTQIVVAGS